MACYWERLLPRAGSVPFCARCYLGLRWSVPAAWLVRQAGHCGWPSVCAGFVKQQECLISFRQK